MPKETDFYTVTMAKVYAEQDHWEKAAEIYRFLLEQEPDREDLVEALAEAEKQMRETAEKKVDNLIPLFRQWIDLMIRYKSLQKLRKLKK